MENKETSIAQLIEHRNENYKLLLHLKSDGPFSPLYDEEFIKKLESTIALQDEQIKQLDKNNLYTPSEF